MGAASSLDRPRDAAPALSREVDALVVGRALARACPFRPGEVDIVYERYSLWSATGSALSTRLGAPLVLELNAPLLQEQARYRRLVMSGLAGKMERLVLRRAAAVLCVSSSLCERARRVRGTDRGVHLFPNAVDTDLFRAVGPRDQDSPREPGPAVVFVGSLKPWHGLPDLLEAFTRLHARLQTARLIIVGEGPERQDLERMASEKGIAGRVQFTGAVPHDRVPELLRGADIAVAPYPRLEDFYFSPLKVGEYLAAGLPVVATDLGDMTAWLERQQAALFVPPGDPEALAAALQKLADDPEMRRRLGAQGRLAAESRLSIQSWAARLRTILKEVAGPAVSNAGAGTAAARNGAMPAGGEMRSQGDSPSEPAPVISFLPGDTTLGTDAALPLEAHSSTEPS
jgi:glycosyltransferase involved in cell wall biosynthesis